MALVILVSPKLIQIMDFSLADDEFDHPWLMDHGLALPKFGRQSKKCNTPTQFYN